MANFTFFSSDRLKKKNEGIITLEKHDAKVESPEYFTYMDNGKEKKYSGVITKTEDGQYIGKYTTQHKVELVYNDAVDEVKPQNEYFSYKDIHGKDKVFIGTPVFDEENQSYIGRVKLENLSDEVIRIYPQE